ncbi:MAG TPA: metal ABC transporter substrate-binding protein [Planctomycetota bacterium]|nr:metal ABC transporter substrate-binding protein [Planctomycetota bacterium]
MRATLHAFALLCALLLATSTARAGDKLRVVATIPDLADITTEVGGERVEVSTIAKGKENLHFVLARPSHLVALSKADALVQVGLSMEMGFIPGLLESCGNPKVQPGGVGFINCSDGWHAIGVPEVLTRQGGDLHPQGNPHMNIDPRGGRHFALRICEGLARVAPQWKGEFEVRRDAYLAKLARAEARWAEIGSHWKGRKLVEYHQEYNYLVELYGLELVANLESKPGIPPTPNHLAGVIEAMKREGCDVIVSALWSRNDYVVRVAEATGARVVELPNMCGGIPGTQTWIGMMDLLHERLAAAFGTPVPERR